MAANEALHKEVAMERADRDDRAADAARHVHALEAELRERCTCV